MSPAAATLSDAVTEEAIAAWKHALFHDFVHDIAALLTGIGMAIETMDADTDSIRGEADRYALELAKLNTRRMGVLIGDAVQIYKFLDRHQVLTTGTFNLLPLVREAVACAGIETPGCVRIECHADVPMARANRALVGRVIACIIGTMRSSAGDAPQLISIKLEAESIGTANGVTARLVCEDSQQDKTHATELNGACLGTVCNFVRLAVESQCGTMGIDLQPARCTVSITIPAV